jgi:protein involved in polysaccharide export with SLBB domain
VKRHGKVTRNPRSFVRALASIVVLGSWMAACSQPTSVPPEPIGPQDQVIRPGDLIRIEVWRQPDYSGEFTVGMDGNVLHPLYQELRVAGRTTAEARTVVERFLANYIQAANVVVEPLYRVSVGGEVRQPAVYPMLRGSTVADAVAMAGGPTALAKLDQVVLLRAGAQYNLRLAQDSLVTFGQLPVVSGDQVLLERRSNFNLFRDVIAPAATLAALWLTVIRIGDERAR